MDSLIDSLATENPNRLYMCESTALGSGLWQDLYEDCESDGISKRAFFIGWWSKRLYAYGKETPQYKRWWLSNPEMSDYEALITRIVETSLSYIIQPEQWAWYRERQNGRSINSMREEMPSVAEEAFQYTGSSFFNLRAVAKDKSALRQLGDNVTFDGYRYTFGKNLLEMDIEQVSNPDEAQLKVWERPIKGAVYAMGIDPAYCSNEESDNAVIEIFRCYADKVVQVAEFAANDVQTSHLAWVMCHLAGEYGEVIFNLEINGPGNEVHRQIKDLRMQIAMDSMAAPKDADEWLKKALEKTRWYIYRRDDSVMAGGGSYNSVTSSKTKPVWLNCMRDLYSSEQFIVRSVDLLDEMRTLRQEGDSIKASGRNSDDRVMAGALATDAYWKHLRPSLIAQNRTFLREMARQQNYELVEPSPDVYNTLIPRYFARRQAEQRQALIDGLRERVLR